jgi:hypothetical protein
LLFPNLFRQPEQPLCEGQRARRLGASFRVLAMWFDVTAALAEVAGDNPAASNRAARPVSQLSRVSQLAAAEKAARVANVARPSAVHRAEEAPDVSRHCASFAGHPRTWTGRVVSLAEWPGLPEWQRHGPNARRRCGCRQNGLNP